MSGKGKKSDGSKGATKKQSGSRSDSNTTVGPPVPSSVEISKKNLNITVNVNQPTQAIKDEIVEGITKKFDSLSTKDREETNGTPRNASSGDSIPPQGGLSREESENDQEAAGGAGQQAKLMADGGTTKKYTDFVSEPMGEKKVSAIPGIGKVSAKKLEKKKWFKAYQIYGQYLALQKNESEFKEFLKKVGVAEKEPDDAYKAMEEYYEKVSKYVHEGFANDRKATTPTLAQ